MNVYYFWSAKPNSMLAILAWHEDAAKAQYRAITGKVHKPRFAKPIIFAVVDDEEIGCVQRIGESPSAPYDTNDADSFPLMSHYGPSGVKNNLGDTAANLDQDVPMLNEYMPWLRLESGEDIKEQIQKETRLFDRRFRNESF
jgi:hypothetical protein